MFNRLKTTISGINYNKCKFLHFSTVEKKQMQYWPFYLLHLSSNRDNNCLAILYSEYYFKPMHLNAPFWGFFVSVFVYFVFLRAFFVVRYFTECVHSFPSTENYLLIGSIDFICSELSVLVFLYNQEEQCVFKNTGNVLEKSIKSLERIN